MQAMPERQSNSKTDYEFPDNPLPGFDRVWLGSEITIGISACGNHETTLKSLQALFLSVEGEYELILVDDCSHDQTLDLFCHAADVHANTKVFSFETNLEYSGSLNAILSHATGKYILFLSNDVWVTPSYIAALFEVAHHSADFGIVRGTSDFVDNGSAAHNIDPGKKLDTFPELFSFSHKIYQQQGDELAFDRFLTGDAFMVSRKLLNAIGTFDPLFYGYFADHDYGVRTMSAGFKLVLARGAFALHKHLANFDCLPEYELIAKKRRRWMRVYENWARFKMKYNLPVELPYAGMQAIEWETLTSAAVSKAAYVPPKDYSSWQLTECDGKQASTNVSQLAKRARTFMFSARLVEAENLCIWGMERSCEKSQVMNTLGGVRLYQGNVTEAIHCFSLALQANPADIKSHSNLLLAMNYSDLCTPHDIFYESKRWEALHCRQCSETVLLPKQNGTHIRLGFISGDMKKHSISYFLEPLFEKIDRNGFQIYCYADVITPDEVTNRLKNHADKWLDITGLDDDAVASVIRDDHVDILVDLAGHTGSRIRLLVFSRKPSPVQLSWLGYPNTSGLTAIDYRLVDDITDPPGCSEQWYTEKLIRLPHGFLCYRPPETAPAITSPPCSKNGFITFGSFSMISKLSPSVITVWARILRNIKNSRLILKCHYFADNATAEAFIKNFADFGITPDRIEVRSSVVSMQDHLDSYNDIDIALDPFPYNGTTTTFEALWMGVPVITLSGDCHASRVGSSILSRIELTEFIALSHNDYIKLAVDLVKNTEVLDSLRKSLRQKLISSAMCDSEGFAKEFEDALRKMMFDFYSA